MKFITFLVWIILLLSSCQKPVSNELNANVFWDEVSKDWIYGNYLSELNFKGIIDRPVGVDLFLFQINFLDRASKRYSSHCVYYKVPFKKIVGEIQVYENRELFNCSETPTTPILYKLTNVKNLEIYSNRNSVQLKFAIGKNAYNFNLPLMNLKGLSVHRRFKEEVEARYKNAMGFIRIDRESKFLPSNNYLGSREDRFSKSNTIQCLHVDKDCKIVGEDFCDKCRFGSFEVVDYNCPQGGSRFCGINHCGEKNEPACIRGKQVKDFENDGICNDDLKPVLNADHISVCQ